MDRLRERVEQELDAVARSGQEISDAELAHKLAAEFSSACGQADVRAAIAMAMRERMHRRPRFG